MCRVPPAPRSISRRPTGLSNFLGSAVSRIRKIVRACKGGSRLVIGEPSVVALAHSYLSVHRTPILRAGTMMSAEQITV